MKPTFGIGISTSLTSFLPCCMSPFLFHHKGPTYSRGKTNQLQAPTVNFKLEAKSNILEMCIFLLCPLYLESFNKEHRVCESTPCDKVEWPDSQQKSLREQVAAWVLEVSAFASSLGISVTFAMLELTKDERSRGGRALQGYAKNSPGCKERMKGSSYETGLGKAQSGRKWAQGFRKRVSPQVRHGEKEQQLGPGLSHLGKRLQGKG